MICFLHDCIITSLAKEVMFLVALVSLSVCLFVCLFVCGQHYSKSYERIGMKFYGRVLSSTRKNWLNFGGDLSIVRWVNEQKNTVIVVAYPDRGEGNDPEPFFFFFFFFRGVGSLSQPRLNIFTIGNMRVMICLGQGGLRSLSASSYHIWREIQFRSTLLLISPLMKHATLPLKKLLVLRIAQTLLVHTICVRQYTTITKRCLPYVSHVTQQCAFPTSRVYGETLSSWQTILYALKKKSDLDNSIFSVNSCTCETGSYHSCTRLVPPAWQIHALLRQTAIIHALI